MKRDSHNLNLGKSNVRFDSTDDNCPKEPTRSDLAPNHAEFLEG